MSATSNERSLTSSPRQIRYWVVSPNVKNNPKTVDDWKEASIREHVAFMGWPHDNPDHRMGPKFAGLTKPGIMPGDVILIARRLDFKPDVVGFGVVHGKYATRLKGFKPPGNEPFGSLRKLLQFKRCSKPPRGIPLIEVLPKNQALVELHPERNNAHKKVCEWMERQLKRKGGKAGEKLRARIEPKYRQKVIPSIKVVNLPENPQLDYKVQTSSKVIRAKKIEAELLDGYRDWLKKKERKLLAATYNRFRCDGYEEKCRNLIEAKASTRREHIRMAVGQLLDYAFQGKKKFGDPNMAILLPKKPDPDTVKWLQHLSISIIWREREEFLDNANRKFS